ncbi:hypothetical protein [Lysobacter claricitrinus]|uniref:hypothetical protein n=1 Tax=Lysobacter claricitrinus TaxID=3367728 RepID=UPI0037DACC2D
MNARPKWLRPVAIVAVLWNVLGCLAFAADARISASDIARMPIEQQHLYAARPGWSVVGTAVAVIAGVLGSVALTQPHRIAWPLLLASLIGVLVQDAGLVIASGGMPATPALAMQGLVLVIAIVLALLAHRYARGLPKA